jgi:protease-4
LLDDLYNAMIDSLVASRDEEREQIVTLIDGGPYTGAAAVEAGLVDGLLYADQVADEIASLFEREVEADDEYRLTRDVSGWATARQIAVVYIDGPIVTGRSASPGLFGGGNTGSATVVEALREAMEDSSVKAVVIRVDSPGGSSYASDEIWRAVERLKEEDKPVIVSMGGVAASGGYYVSAGATVIYAEPTTITGSIGVYGGTFSLGQLYEKIGVTHEIHSRGRMSAMYSSSRPMDAMEFDAMDRLVESVYQQFKDKVAQGRGMEMEQVESVARGRVWTGMRAHELGLVDELGGLQDAIARARSEAGISENAEVRLISYSGGQGLLGEMAPELIRAFFPAPVPVPPALSQATAYAPLWNERVLALLPWAVEIN